MPKALAKTVATATITLSTMLKADGFLGCCSGCFIDYKFKFVI